eukprot:m.82296 g.82296  ORF g.82296 m.82296 type:complete len:1149 (+) comp9456_c0_seq1:212-3658(+)
MRGLYVAVLWALCIGASTVVRGLAVLGSGSRASGRPVDRHVGTWSSAPKKCPSDMVTDGPLLGNGDLGAAVGGVQSGNNVVPSVSVYLGKMDFWSQTSGPGAKRVDQRHLSTHVAPGRVQLTWMNPGSTPPPPSPPPSTNCSIFGCDCTACMLKYCMVPGKSWGCAPEWVQAWWREHHCQPTLQPCNNPTCSDADGFQATQDLGQARVNFSVASTVHGYLNASAIIARDENVLLTRLVFANDVTVTLNLSTPNIYALPARAQSIAHTGLGLSREANAWINNAVVLSECDAGMLSTVSLRGVQLETTTGRVQWVNATAAAAGLPNAVQCPMVIDHPLYGNATLGSGLCGPEGSASDWRFVPTHPGGTNGTIRRHRVHPRPVGIDINDNDDDLCVVAANGTTGPVTVAPCVVSPPNEAVWGVVETGNVPEGGSRMLRAMGVARPDVDWGTGTACSRSSSGQPLPCSAGMACCAWQTAGGCLTAPAPMLNISLGMAAVLTDLDGTPIHPSAIHVAPPAKPEHSPSVVANYSIKRGTEYVLRVAIATHRPPRNPNAPTTPLTDAYTTAIGADLVSLEHTHAQWWDAWWNVSAVDLGSRYRVLESFYYGAQYMLGCLSRNGGVAAGLLGPWSLQDPVGWEDHLTLDYNVEANYWGAASSNRLDAMLPYFPMATALIPECRRRAALKTWSHGGHSAFNIWGQASEMIGCGPTSFSVMGGCPDDYGGYDGLECPSATGFVKELQTGHDSSTRFVAALMATPYVDYYEASMDTTFLREQAYPFVSGAADFYASYATKNATSGGYDLLFTCAQEICSQRQGHGSYVNHNSLIDLAHAKFVLDKATAYARVLNVDPDPKWAQVSNGLAPLPMTMDSATFPGLDPPSPLTASNRTVWSESWIERNTPGTGHGNCVKSPENCTLEVAEFATNYMYPIIHFSAIHPTGLIGLRSDAYSGNDTAAHAKLLQVARNTVWGDNERSGWAPVNGLCLAWPSATRVTDGAIPGQSALLLARFETALNHTMQPNFWPSMNGGGVEQIGATIAINELLLQSHEGFISLFPAWGQGTPASFTSLRARGGFVVSAAMDATRTVLPGVSVVSDVGGDCYMYPPWPGRAPKVTDTTGANGTGQVTVPVSATSVRGVSVYVWKTETGHTYSLS